MTDDDRAFDAEIRRRAGVGRKLTLNAETDDERTAQAAFRAELVSGNDRAGEIGRRLFGEAAASDEGTP